MDSIPLVVITGPTASGKSSFAIDLAKEIGGEIISADSAQVYKDLKIITARLSPKEMQGIPHHLMGFLGIENDFSVADFQKKAYTLIEEIKDRGNIPIMVGGTILYIKAVCEAYLLPDIPPDPVFRSHLEEIAKSKGKSALYEELVRKDPISARRIHPHNLRRIIRALEVIEKTGKPFSEFYKKISPHPLGISPLYYWISMPRQVLYQRIDKRVDVMMSQGAIDEVKSLILQGKREHLLKRKILGTLEIMYILDGLCTIQEGVHLIKRNTRRYAKRQITWLKSLKAKEIPLLNLTETEFVKIKEEIKRKLKNL